MTVSNEMREIWKEPIVTCLQFEVLYWRVSWGPETTISGRWCPDRDWNQAPLHYKSEVLALDPACSVLFPCNDKVTVFLFSFALQIASVLKECSPSVLLTLVSTVLFYFMLLFYVVIKRTS